MISFDTKRTLPLQQIKQSSIATNPYKIHVQPMVSFDTKRTLPTQQIKQSSIATNPYKKTRSAKLNDFL